MALRRDGPSKTPRWTLAKLDRLSEDNDELFSFLNIHNIVSFNRQCKKYGKNNMMINQRANGQVRFICGKRVQPGGKKCSGGEGLLVNSFMTRRNLLVIIILKFIYLWLSGMELQKISEEIGMAKHTLVYWNRYCRQVACRSVQKRATPIGGFDDVVEIDEKKFGGRKYNRGHRVEGSWVFWWHLAQLWKGILGSSGETGSCDASSAY